ncbi:MAG: inositol monophosphatase [Sulfuricellaceae bacterium]|nr:inositol monophosphatase [Sulfuricellaceae bacterium]
MLEDLTDAIRRVAINEIMPRYLKVARQHKDDGSLCTEADLAAQAALIEAVLRIENCTVLGEEMTAAEQQAQWDQGNDGLWCIDPIDGTSNFVNGLPYFAVSVALWRNGRPVLGAVYDPVADEMYCAQKGRGAWLNGEPLPIKTFCPAGLSAAMACIDFKRLDRPLRERLGVSPPYRSQRNFGASALDWCYVAAGRIDIYLHGGQKLWDYAAGVLILQEAGGTMCSLENDDFWSGEPWQRSVIAALNPAMFESWKNWVYSAAEKR